MGVLHAEAEAEIILRVISQRVMITEGKRGKGFSD